MREQERNGYRTGNGTGKNSTMSRSRQRRREVLRRKLLLSVFTVCLIISLSLIASASRSKAVAEKEQKFKYYTRIEVREGDTLWQIADRFLDDGTGSKTSYIKEIKSINHLRDENEITAGQMLIVPYYSSEYIAD